MAFVRPGLSLGDDLRFFHKCNQNARRRVMIATGLSVWAGLQGMWRPADNLNCDLLAGDARKGLGMANGRKRAWLRDLGVTPWWVYALVGAAALAGVRAGTGVLARPSPFLPVAWMLPGLVLLAACWAAQRQWSRRRLLERQTDLDSIRSLPWDEFQQLVGEAYRRLGYHVQEVGGDGRHGGVDLVLRKHGRVTLVECRRWRTRKVRPLNLRELQGVLATEHADQGVLVTTGAYTPEAERFARERGISLLDGPQLLKLVRSVRRQAVAPPRPVRTGVKRCPQCGREMSLRTVQSVEARAGRYWRCNGFPRCRGTRVVGAVVGRSRLREPLQGA